jgi:hypothetical protein
MKFLPIALLIAFLPGALQGQQRVLFNGATLTIANGGVVVVDNPAPNALTVLNSGGISSEGPNNNLIWNIGMQSGSYHVPFVTGSMPIPVLFTTAAAAGNGQFVFSTYAGSNWQNRSYLPPTVTNVNMGGADNSNHVIDRFWQFNPSGYTTQPTLSNVSFSYVDNEWQETGNSIAEVTLAAQNWDNTSGAWLNPPLGIDDPTQNQVTIATLSQPVVYPWWTLVSSGLPLPLTLLSFTLEKENGSADLNWIVSDQVNTSFFDVQRSVDGLDFTSIGTVAASGTSSVSMDYSYRDPLNGISQGSVFYRLRMVDIDGISSYSPVREIAVDGSDQPLVAISPNPASILLILRFGAVPEGRFDLIIVSAGGQMVKSQQIAVAQHAAFYFSRPSGMAAGTYFVTIKG